MTIVEIDVIVVGAGAAGLRAANYLMLTNPDLQVSIIEARDRCGGRTCSQVVENSSSPPDKVDVGGQWVGPGQTRVLSLIKKYNLRLIEQEYTPSNESDNKMNSNALECGSCKIISPSSESWKFLSKLDEISKEIDLYNTFDNPKVFDYDKISVEEYINQVVSEIDSRLECIIYVQSIIGYPPKKCSLLMFLMMLHGAGGIDAMSDGDQGSQKWKVGGGFQQVSICMLNELLSNSNFQIHYSHRVINITQDMDTNKPIAVTCINLNTQNTVTFAAKRCIFAMSPTLIKKGNIQFTPSLPLEKQLIVDRMEMGSCIKFIIAFKTAFWKEYSKTISIHDFYHSYHCHNIFMSQIGEYPALVCLSTGTPAQYLCTLSADERKELVINQLYNMYMEYPVRYDLKQDCVYQSKETTLSVTQTLSHAHSNNNESKTNSDNDINISNHYCHSGDSTLTSLYKPIYYIEKNWVSEEYSGGCFAGMYPPGLLTRVKDAIRKPYHHIYFAGTETAQVYYAYVEGALESGERAANEVLESLQML